MNPSNIKYNIKFTGMKYLIIFLFLSCSLEIEPIRDCEEWNIYVNDYYDIEIEQIKNGFEKLDSGTMKEIELLESKRNKKLKECE